MVKKEVIAARLEKLQEYLKIMNYPAACGEVVH